MFGGGQSPAVGNSGSSGGAGGAGGTGSTLSAPYDGVPPNTSHSEGQSGLTMFSEVLPDIVTLVLEVHVCCPLLLVVGGLGEGARWVGGGGGVEES